MSKRRIPADEFAEVLLSEFINSPAHDPSPPRPLTEHEAERFSGKARVYKLAIVLHCLRTEEKTIDSFEKVRTILEHMVLPDSEAESVPIIMAINSAMKDIGSLISPGKSGYIFTWSRDWLGGIAIDETNPVTLGMLAIHWTQVVTDITKLMAKHNPH